MNKRFVAMKKLSHVLGLLVLLGLSFTLHAAVEIKQSAPSTYTVKPKDTLWDIANLFLDKPWLWPELWRKNTQIENPHLIYPGDVITIRYVDGEPVIAIAREKRQMVLKPGVGRVEKINQPINLLPWSVIAPYIDQHLIVNEDDYEDLPQLLGNQQGHVRFVDQQLVLSQIENPALVQYRLMRRDTIIKNIDGDILGVQLRHVGDADLVATAEDDHGVVALTSVNEETKPGDKLMTLEHPSPPFLKLQGAETQRGFIVGSLHQYNLLGKYDVVVVDLGQRDIEPGTVMGIYARGPEIIDGEPPQYSNAFTGVGDGLRFWDKVTQPAMKIGELMVFSTFDNASYAIITRANDTVKRGAIVGKP